MTDSKLQTAPPERERRRAADLRTGDRIIPGDLVGATAVEEVLGVHLFADELTGKPSVALVIRPDDRNAVLMGYCDADQLIALDQLTVDVPEYVAGQAVGRASVHADEGGQSGPFYCATCLAAYASFRDWAEHQKALHGDS